MKRKLTFQALSSLLIETNNGYTDFIRGKYKSPDGVLYPGYLYGIEKPISQQQRETIERYSNTVVSERRHRYAPELINVVVFLSDKCMREYKKETGV